MRIQLGPLRLVVLTVFIFVAGNTCFGQTNDFKPRPANWAIPLYEPGLTNFYKVTTNLYRGAQPTAEGMKELTKLGIKTVLNLRSFHSDTSLVSRGDLKLARLHMKPWHAEDEDVVAFLKIVSNTNNLPVYVHCQRGADRTGMVCAMYRIVVCGWTKDAAIQEMRDGGFHFYPGWRNLVDYIENVNVDGLKKRAGIAGQ